MLISVDVECWLCGRLIVDKKPTPWTRKSDESVLYSCNVCFHKANFLIRKYKYELAQIREMLTNRCVSFCGGD